MLTSLFGDLNPARGPNDPRDDDATLPSAPFSATAILESVATDVNERGQMVDRHSRDLVVSGSPARAIREHFAATRSDLDTARAMLTLLDPVGVWAAAVIKALSDAGGQPIERLHLREPTTLRTLATIERTTLARRDDDALRVYHAEVRAPGSENAEIQIALMERSQMTTVIIGPLQPHAIDALLSALHHAAMLPSWRCPDLLFLLPPNAVWINNKVNAVPWPGRLHVHVLSESLSGASAVWNAMLGVWNQVRARVGWEPAVSGPGALYPATGASMRVRDPATQAASVGAPLASGGGLLDPARMRLALAGMLAVDGLLACAVVDGHSGTLLAREVLPECRVDLEAVAAAAAVLLRTHRRAAPELGLSEPLDEIVSSAGAAQLILRPLARMPPLFVVVLLARERSNLALARYQMMELEHGLAASHLPG